MKHYNFDEIIDRSGSDSFKYDFREVMFGNTDVLPMWVADMDFRTPDFVLLALEQRLKHPVLGYSLKSESYYRAIINWLDRRHNWKIKREWISFSPGVVPALTMSVMAFSNPGDKIIVQTPVYFPFFTCIAGPGREVIYNPLKLEQDRYVMDLDHLRSQIDARTRMLFLCHPHNPGGMVWSREELLALAEICLEHRLIIVSDEIHSDLVFRPNRHIPLASLSEIIASQVVTCMAPSKTFNLAGLSTAFVVSGNPNLLRKYNQVLDYLHLQIGNIFGNVALEAAYSQGEEWLEQLLNYVQGNIRYAVDYMRRHIPPIKPMVPQATYMLWLDCRDLGLKQAELRQFMIHKARLGLNDGAMFGIGGEGFMRMNLACPRSVVKEAMQRLRAAVDELFHS